MESTAIFKLLWQGETTGVPKTINITVEYLRGARPEDVFARAEFTRHGRRVANVRVFAYQDDPERPAAVATAHFLLVQD
jgi:acyl-coenzyme A thioesterase PaaI-like protein